MNLNDFMAWQAEPETRRGVTIHIERKFMSPEQEVRVWVYDYELRVGQFVSSVAEINLEAQKAEADRKKLAELLAKRAEIDKKLGAVNA